MTDTVTLPRLTAAYLVAGHVDNLWGQWANDTDVPGCCPDCCAPCAALRDLRDSGQLDDLYAAYVDHVGGEHDTWDAERRQVGRAWLDEAWTADLTCHHAEARRELDPTGFDFARAVRDPAVRAQLAATGFDSGAGDVLVAWPDGETIGQATARIPDDCRRALLVARAEHLETGWLLTWAPAKGSS